jgi:gliding motility-associated lipoprotein GldD
MTRYASLFFLLILCCIACGEEAVITPRPRAYPKIDFPEKTYQAFDKNYCNFGFQYPTYTEIVQDTSFFDEKPVHPCWFDIFYPSFDARLHFTYASISTPEELSELKNDAFRLVDWQNKRANYIEEIRIQKADTNVEGMAFDISGPAASPFQFYLTDSDKHFVRASLYFNTHINPDSLAPLYDFVKMDITQLIDTFEWED